jgi:hypothetical protein
MGKGKQNERLRQMISPTRADRDSTEFTAHSVFTTALFFSCLPLRIIELFYVTLFCAAFGCAMLEGRAFGAIQA